MLQLLKECFTWWNRRTLSLRFHLYWKGTKVGEDHYGNQYYLSGKRRYIVYAGEAEATAIPVSWHCWLRKLTDILPPPDPFSDASPSSAPLYPPTVNTTGSALAYRKKPLEDTHYTPWKPVAIKKSTQK